MSFESWFEKTWRDDPDLGTFAAAPDVIAFLHSTGEKAYARKDAILIALIEAWQRSDGVERRRLGSILMLALRPALERIVHSLHVKARRRCDLDREWADTTFAFFEIVSTYPTKRRPFHVAANLKLDTLNRRCRMERDDIRDRRARKTVVADARSCGPAAVASTSHDPAGTEMDPTSLANRDFGDEFVLACDMAAADGAISAEDRTLLLGTRLYGEHLRDHAGRLGISYEAAKKRRQRSEAFIRSLLRDWAPPRLSED